LEIVRASDRNQVPKLGRVVELANVTKLVDDNIIREQGWQQNNPVIKIQIAHFRTTAPTRPLISDTYSANFENKTACDINFLEMFNPVLHQTPRRLFVFQIIFPRAFARHPSDSPSPHSAQPKSIQKSFAKKFDLFFHFLEFYHTTQK
jgi:hypothetical protein